MTTRINTYSTEASRVSQAGRAAVDPLHAVLVGAGYLVGYVALDWVSFVQPFGSFGITPWNPYTGLSFALVLLAGRSYVPLLFVAPLVADYILRDFSIPAPYAVLYSLVVGMGYAGATWVLSSPKTQFDVRLPAARDIVTLLVVAAVSATFVAVGYVLILAYAGFLLPRDYVAAISRHWVGDAIGIAILTPSLLLLRHANRSEMPSLWALLQPIATIAVLWLIFGYTWGSRFQLLYLLFLPVVWIAMSSGVVGACFGLMTTQISLMVALQFAVRGPVNITAYQIVMLVLTATGLAIGAVVSERRRTERQLRMMQDAQARFDRLGSMGALSATLAHEINQPLSAAATYSRLANEALSGQDRKPDIAKVRELAEKSAAQVQRAASVMRRLRDLLQHGSISPQSENPERIVQESIALMESEIARASVRLTTSVANGLPMVAADRLQIEQVLINVIRNSIEAIEGDTRIGKRDRRINVTVTHVNDGEVKFIVSDTGPGFAEEHLGRGGMPFTTTKSQGLGIGLALCETIIRSHGGELIVANGAEGAIVAFTLKEVGRQEDEEENSR